MALSPDLEILFPNTVNNPFLETSPPTRGANSIPYNCIAWACEDMTAWYWPDYMSFWPENIPYEVTLDAFRQLFERKGYEICGDSTLEEGFQKVAIYCKNNIPTHAARQLPDGQWTSKLGFEHDVSHTIESMEDSYYGNVFIFMKKKSG